MSFKLHKLLPVSAAVVAFAGIAGTANADQVVKIGHVGPLTGGSAHLGKDNENGARLAIEEINAKGLTIDGQKITLVLDAQDDAGDPRQATQVAQKLVDDKVVAVVGHLNSGASIRGLEDLQRRWHRADLAVVDEPGVHPAGLQDDLPRRRDRCAARSGTRDLRREDAEREDRGRGR
ncbi:hypothetical protein OKW28_001328 [Paraburkholderia sp. 40]